MRYRVKAIRGASEVAMLPVDALDEAEASAYVRRQGYEVVSVRREASFGLPTFSRKTAFPVIQFSQELIALLSAGLTLVEAIEILERKEQKPGHKNVLNDLLARLRQGMRFSAALEAFPTLFSPLYVATVRASERTGAVKDAVARYIDYQLQVQQVRSKIVSASIYPVLLLTVGILVTLFLLGYVVPRFSRVYQDFGERLPLVSRWLMQAGQTIDAHGTIVLGAILGLCAIAYYLVSQPATRHYLQSLVMRLPIPSTVG